MKILVYSEKRAEPEKTVQLKLIETPRGVSLVVVDDDGKEVLGGMIATIDPSGCLIVIPNLNPRINLPISTRHGGIAIITPDLEE